MLTPADPAGAQHIPVLQEEVLAGLDVQPGGRYIDGTLGGGGHTRAILHASQPDGRVLGLDADPAAIRRVQAALAQPAETGRLLLVQTPFDQMEVIARREGFAPVDGVLLDLGLSSFHLETPQRGFAFQHDGPLDMRFDPTAGISAAELLNQAEEAEIANILYEFGEERRSRRIAREIVRNRPITTTAELAEIVSRAVGGRGQQKIHPATRTFQALRMAVNDELGQLERTLPQALALLRPGGRLAVIAFHSLEDRLVKRWMQNLARSFVPDPSLPAGGREQQPALARINKKPIGPTPAEIKKNPRSRSAKLRIAEKIVSAESEI